MCLRIWHVRTPLLYRQLRRHQQTHVTESPIPPCLCHTAYEGYPCSGFVVTLVSTDSRIWLRHLRLVHPNLCPPPRSFEGESLLGQWKGKTIQGCRTPSCRGGDFSFGRTLLEIYMWDRHKKVIIPHIPIHPQCLDFKMMFC